MSCVHYKFKSSLDYDTLKFDGLHITLADLKKAIIQQKKLGKTTDFDLQVINAQTKEEYGSNEDLIPRNASVIIARVPIGGKPWEKSQVDMGSKAKAMKMSLERLSKTADLVGADASEEDKIKAMMTQSTKDYDRSNYVKPSYLTGPPPTGYLCYRCGQAGHFIQNCSLPKPDRHNDSEPARIKRSSGIPNSFLTIVDDPTVRGAVMTSSGRLAVPTIDAMAYEKGKKEKPPFIKSHSPERRVSDEKMIPGELLCTLCSDLLSDAVVIPCCGNSYCDECIREALLDSEDHTCPSCKESVSPDGLIANKFLRTAVNNFLNETGYTKARRRSGKHEEPATQPPTSRHRPRDRDDDRHSDRKQVQPVSASDLMVLRQEASLSDELIGLPPQVVKARQAELTRGSSPQGGSTPPPRHDYHSRHHDDRRRDDRRRDDRRDDRRHSDRRRDDRRDDRHHAPRTPTADEPMMSPPQAQMMQAMGQQQQQQQQQQQPQLMPPQQQQPPGGPMGMPPQQPPQQQNMVPQFNQGPPQNKFFSPPMVNNGPPPGSVPPGAMRPPMNMPGPPPPGMQMPQQNCVPQQPPPPGASMPMMPNQFPPQGPIQQPPPQPMPPQMIPPQQPMQQGPMPMMPMPGGPMPPNFRGPAPPGPQMGMPGPPGGDPRLPLPNWGPRPPFPAPGPPPMSEQEFYREKQRLLEKTKPLHPRHDPMDDFEMKLMRYHSERRKNKSFSRSRSRSKSPATRLRSSRSKSRPLSHSRSRSRSRSVKRSRSRSKMRSRSRSKKRSRSRSKKRSRSRSKKRSRSRSKNRSRSRSKKRSRSWSKKRSRSRSKKRSRSRSVKRSRSRPRSYGRSLSRTRSSSSWSSKLSRSRSRSRPRRRSLSRSLSKSPQPRVRRRKRSRSPGHRAPSPLPPPGAPPGGGFYNYRGGRRSRSPPPPMPPYMRGGKDWVSPPGFFRDRSPGRMKGYSPERYPYPYGAQPRFEEMYRYPERIDPRWLEYYREYDNYMREMQDRFGPPPPRYDMPWPGTGGRSPPPQPPPRPVMDVHRSRSKLKKTKKEKGSRHGHEHDPRDVKLTQKESEKERRAHREKGKLRDGEKEARVKKAPSSGQEEKAALRHVAPKEGAEWGSSHSPHGKVRKRREEGAQPPLKDLRAKLTEKPAEVKVMAAAVSVKAPKVESTDKTLPEGEAVVAVKKVRKSKVKAARVKGSKKAKKEAVNGEAQINEKTVKRPASAYPSAGVPDVVSPPKKAKMEADTTCHEDEIPAAPEVELKVAEVKAEKEEPAAGKEVPQQIGLVVTPPELSKWERDDYDMNDTGVSPRRKPEVKRLPRSVIESAEKVLSQKRPQVVASTVVSPPPSRSTSHKSNKEVERDRKVVSGGPSSVQVTITSSSSDKRRPSTEGKLTGKEKKKEVTTEADKWKGERRSEVGEKRREAGTKYREEGTKYREEGTKYREEGTKYREEGTKFREVGSRHGDVGGKHQDVGAKHQEASVRRKDAGDRHREARDVKALKSDSRGSSRDAAPRRKSVSKADPDNIPSPRVSLEKENKLGKSQSAKSRDDAADDGHREHTQQPGRHISRKISVMDEANFEPDYNEDSQSDSESETKASKQEEDESTGSSGEEAKKKKKKKHKHKHRKHKHKKHKHK